VRWSRLRPVPVIAACIGALLTVALSPSPAHADEVVIDMPVSNISQPIQGEFLIDAGQLQSFDIDLPPGSGIQTATQCVDIPDVGKWCNGAPAGTEDIPLDVTGGESLHGLVKWSDEARAALNWMIPEGAEYIRTLNDLPSDDRILTYARPQLRTYIVAELLSIMDKKRDGQPLTENEQNALAFVENEYMERDRMVAQFAWEEYLHFKADPCNYVVPAAPRSVDKPEKMPKKVIDWCKLPKQQVAEFFTFVPPLPSPAQFTAWGSYRHATEVGLDAFDRNVPLKNLVDMTKVTAAMGGVAAASSQGMLLGAGATLASLATIGVKVFPFASRQLFHSSLELGGQFITNMSGAASGLLATAIIAAVLIVFLVVTGVAVYLLIEHESVSDTLRDRVDVTTKETDPFNLVDPPLGPPNHRTKDFYFALAAQVAKWTSTYHEQAPGMPPTVVGTSPADPKGIWPDGAPDIDDPTWLIQVADAKRAVERTSLEIPHDKGVAKLRYSDGWPVITPPGGGQPQPALEFGYRDVNDVPVVVTGQPASRTGFIVSGTHDTGVDFTGQTRTLVFKNEKGEVVRARLKAPAPTYLAGPRPAAVGPMFAGRPVMLRPNPVGVNGRSLDDAVVQADWEFDWTVEQFDHVSGEWTEVPVTDGFGTSFVPTEPGEYDARVTMTSVDDPDTHRYGSVRFTVTSPPVEPLIATLIDNGSNRLELDLQLREEVPGDTFDVEVTWPGQLGDEEQPTQSITLDCTQTGPIECTTPRTGDQNSLVWAVDPFTDVRQPIKVTVTNSTGGGYEGAFVLGEGRPVFAPPPAGANDGESGTVLVGENSTQVTMVPPDPASNVDFVVARLVPSAGGGQGFTMVNPTNGNIVSTFALPQLTNGAVDIYEDGGSWYLGVRGIPDMASMGTFEIPVVVVQSNGTRQLIVIVVTIAPSTDDQYRGAIQSTVDPLDFAVDAPPDLFPVVLGGRVDEPKYDGRMCIRLDEAMPGGVKTRCGPIADFLNANGVPKPISYPQLFPGGLPAGTYRAEAWLATAGDRVDRRPIGASFILTEDASYPRPKAALGNVDVTGKAQVGKKLKATVGATDPTSATLTYQWLRDGKVVTNATGKAYKLKGADRGHRISVRVTASVDEWRATTKTSAKTAPVR